MADSFQELIAAVQDPRIEQASPLGETWADAVLADPVVIEILNHSARLWWLGDLSVEALALLEAWRAIHDA